jgi:F0F1-type ATP synthase gamma subunit
MRCLWASFTDGKIQDMNKKLLLQYFKRRHEVIDQNMREIFCAAKTMHVEL